MGILTNIIIMALLGKGMNNGDIVLKWNMVIAIGGYTWGICTQWGLYHGLFLSVPKYMKQYSLPTSISCIDTLI